MLRLRHACAALLVAAVTTLALQALAHDQWIEAAVGSGALGAGGATVSARLFVGEAPFGDEEKPFERARFSRLEQWSRNGRTDLLATATEGAKPLVTTSGLGEGEFLFALDRTPVLIELAPAKFEAYLVEEGLGAIVKDRAARGESDKPGRERYTRYAKGLVQVRTTASQGMTSKRIGQRLELLVEPPRVGEPFAVHVTFDGQPLASARVQASLRPPGARPDAGAHDTAATTDARGTATLQVGAAGFLVVHLVHMRRCVNAGKPCPDAEWESFWGSLSTTVP